MASGTWAVDASGNWSTTGNWSGGTVADGATFTANFTNNITATRTVTVDTVRTIGNITFSDNGASGSAWVLSGANALTLDNGGSAPVLNVVTGTTISAPITGTAGFTKSGAGTLELSNANTGLSGSIAVTQGVMNLTSAAASVLPNVSAFAISASSVMQYWYGTTASVTAGTVYSGAGVLQLVKNVATDPASGVTFPAGALANMTGNNAPTGSVPTLSATSGFGLYTAAATNFQISRATINDLPRRIFHQNDANSASTQTATWTYVGAGGSFLTDVDIVTNTSSGLAATTKLLSNSTASGLVLQGGVTPYGVTGTRTFRIGGTSAFDNAIQGVIANGAGTLALTKEDAGKWILSGANTYTGTTSISAGTLSAQSAAAFGAAASAVTQTGGTIDVSGGVALNKTGGALTLISAAGATALSTTTGTNTLACAGITLSSTIIVDAAAGASLAVNNTAAMSGAFGITKNNSGEIGLGTFANTYTGAVTINAGTLTVGNLQNTSTASSLGTGALSSAIALTGTLKYNGTGHSTNRSITFTGSAPVLDASGSGAVTYSACTQAAGARTITLTGTSLAAVNNTFSATLADGTGAVGVAKTGSNKWILSGALNHTGTTSCAEGTLNFGSTNRTLSGALSVSGGTVENSTNTISANTTMTGGTITAQLTGNKTLDVTSGSATLQPVNNVNDFSGATTVAAGATLKLITGLNPSLGSGRVLGTSNVSVSGNLRTDGSATQKGQMRYGGNLTFQAGAKLYVGSLA